MTPIFESHTLASMERAKQTFVGRGTEYGDTWRECRFLKMKAVASARKHSSGMASFNSLATAAFCDMKYWRNLGGFKDDSLIDEMNYDGFLAEEMLQLTRPPLPDGASAQLVQVSE